MPQQKTPPSLSQYVVVMRAAAGFHFGEPDKALIIRSFPTPVGPSDFLFASRFAPAPGFSTSVCRGLRVEARGYAQSLHAAAEAFSNGARSLAVILSFCANVECEDLTFEIVFDDTPGKTEREFFQQFVPEERWMPHSGRSVPRSAVWAVMNALNTHSETGRLHRAIVHYHYALQNWEPGAETFALAHLYIGMEALTPVASRQHQVREGITREELARSWGVDWADEQQRRGFDPEVRRRLLFGGDDATYLAAKKASDAYEHSFKSMPDVRTLAIEARDKTADYVRRAVLDLANVDQSAKDVLLNPPYVEPMFWTIVKYVRGTILGAGDELAASDQQYPILDWKSTVREPEESDAAVEVGFDERITPRLANGLTFRLDRFEVWGPPRETTVVYTEPAV